MLQSLVLAAGEGTRLRPLTFTIPKPLIPIMGKPVIEYIIDRLRESGITNIGIVIGYLGHLFIEHLGNGSRLDVQLTYIKQEKRLGIAHAIYRAIEDGFIKKSFVVHLGDNYFEEHIRNFVKRFRESDADVFIVLTKYKDPTRFGYVVLENGKVKKLIEKPKEPPPGGYTLTGIYMFRDPDLVTKAFKELKPSWRGEYEITDLIQWFINHGYRVNYVVTNGWWKDTGTPQDILELMYLMLDKIETRIEGEVKGEVVGRVIVEKGAIIEGQVYGPAYIGRNVYVGKSVKIEHFVDIENETQIISGQLSRSLILPKSIIEMNNARMIDSIIGMRVFVTLRNGLYRLILGDYSIVQTQ